MRMLTETWENMVVGGNTQTLPVRRASELASHADIVAHMRACPPRPARIAANDHGQIFVVDAYLELASGAARMLEQGGYRTRTFDCTMTAWHAFAFANPKPDVLITYDGGGELPGLALLELCKKMNPKLKTLLITHRHRSELARSERARVDDVILPIYDGKRLTERVGKLLGNDAWDWGKFRGAVGLLFSKCHPATA